MATAQQIQEIINGLPDGDDKNNYQIRLDALTSNNQTKGMVEGDTLENLLQAVNSPATATTTTTDDFGGGRRRKYSRRGRRSAKKRGTQRKQKRHQRRASRRAY